MSIESKLSQLDSLERIELEMELEKKLEKKKDCEFKRTIEMNTEAKGAMADRLVEALDKRYVKRQP